jgi:membrane-bound lytic murein transglycosylase D
MNKYTTLLLLCTVAGLAVGCSNVATKPTVGKVSSDKKVLTYVEEIDEGSEEFFDTLPQWKDDKSLTSVWLHPASKQTLFLQKVFTDSERYEYQQAQVYEQLPSQYDNLWHRLRAGYKLQVKDNEEIERTVEYFSRKSQFFENVSQRARPYLYHIVHELERRKMPLELALLPIIESSFRPTALSPKKAAGVWQFIPSTGRNYGLRQNRFYDGRRDVLASTRAALDYLEKLNEMFDGDWLLSVAAYNCGEGAVQRAIRKNEAREKPTDFWALDLPRETRQYVPNLIAVSKIVAEPEKHDVTLSYISNRPYLQNVNVGTQINLNLAAKLAGLSTHEFNRLNPGYRLGVTDPDGPHLLTLPIDKVDNFKQQLTALPVELLTGGAAKRKQVEEESDESTVESDQSTEVAAAPQPVKPQTLVAEAETEVAEEAVAAEETEEVAVSEPRARKRYRYFRQVAPVKTFRPERKIPEKVSEPKANSKSKVISDKDDKKKSSTSSVKGETLFKIARAYKVSLAEPARVASNSSKKVKK